MFLGSCLASLSLNFVICKSEIITPLPPRVGVRVKRGKRGRSAERVLDNTGCRLWAAAALLLFAVLEHLKMRTAAAVKGIPLLLDRQLSLKV